MIVSTKGRYALRVLVDLAEHKSEEYIPLKEIADRQGISEKYLENILKSLVKNKIISGLRGKGGGYRLSVDPSMLTAGAVLRLTETSLTSVACLNEGSDHCERMSDCRTLPLWKGLDKLVSDYLDNVTLTDLINGKIRPV